MRKKNGFTLIELIITLTIIGVLSAILIPSFGKIQTSAKETAAKANTHALQMAIESHLISHSTYPQTTKAGITDLITTLTSSGELKKAPQNPFTATPYTDADTAGKLTYTYNKATDTYTLTLKNKTGTTTLLELNNL